MTSPLGQAAQATDPEEFLKVPAAQRTHTPSCGENPALHTQGAADEDALALTHAQLLMEVDVHHMLLLDRQLVF